MGYESDVKDALFEWYESLDNLARDAQDVKMELRRVAVKDFHRERRESRAQTVTNLAFLYEKMSERGSDTESSQSLIDIEPIIS